MGIIRFAVENPVKVAVAVVLLVIFGALSLFEIPVQLTPDVDRPVITVTTVWPGASPQEIEREIVDRQEEKLKAVTNLKKMTSTSTEGTSVIKLEFPVGVDKNVAYRDVSDKLRQVGGYPDEVDEPVMSATDDEMENIIAWLILYADEKHDIAHLKTYVEDHVKPLLERAEGIAGVDVYGGLDREIQLVIDPYLLASRGLTLRDVESAVRRQNTNISAGTIPGGKRDFAYRTLGEFSDLRQIEDTIISYQSGGPVTVRDVATVVDGFAKQYAFVRSEGEFVIAIPARRESGANIITAMKNLERQIDLVNREVLRPRGMGLELRKVYDATVYIWSAIDLVIQNLYIGGILAVLVLLLFLRSGSATTVIAISIPITVMGTFLIMSALGRTLNVVSLAGMSFAVGMVVDNAIVVLENIYRHRSLGKPAVQACLDGAHEVWGAVLASTLTTLAVFLPVIFIQEEAGQLFRDISIAISAAIALSLVVSVVVVPPLASRLMGKSRNTTATTADDTFFVGRWLGALTTAVNRRRAVRLGVIVGLTGSALGLGAWLMPPTEYLPPGNQNLVFGFIFSPPGYSVDEYKRMARIVEEGDGTDPYSGVRAFWEARLGTPSSEQIPDVVLPVGIKGDRLQRVKPPPIENFFYVAWAGQAFMGCTSQDPDNVAPLTHVMNRAGQRIPGVFTFFMQTSLFSSGGAGNSVDVEIRGDDLTAVADSASAILGKLMEVGYGYPSPNPPNFAQGRPEVRVIPNRAKAADLGLNVLDVGFIVEACVNGAFVGEYNDRGDRVDMVLRIEGLNSATSEEVARVPIVTPSGHVVPLLSAADLQRTTAPQQINHIEEMGSVTLSVQSKTGVPLQETMREIEDSVIAPLRASGIVPSTVITGLAGTASKLTQTQNALLGDFRETFTRPRLLGLSAPGSTILLAMLVVVVALAVRMIAGPRPATMTLVLLGIAVAVAVMSMNPQFARALVTSRMMLALLITYLLMAALFESFIYPFIIMFAVPPAAFGGVAALQIVHYISLNDVTVPVQQLDVLTMLGFVILIGVVVNNAILIVHQALNNMREGGMDPYAAVAYSVQTRTRPIFMTAFTSLFGMLPLVVMPGAGSELYRGLGAVVLGGLLVSTVFTLVVIPAMFTLFLDLQRWWVASKGVVRTATSPALAAVSEGATSS